MLLTLCCRLLIGKTKCGTKLLLGKKYWAEDTRQSNVMRGRPTWTLLTRQYGKVVIPSVSFKVLSAASTHSVNCSMHCPGQDLKLRSVASVELKQIFSLPQQQYGLFVFSGRYFMLKLLSYFCSVTCNSP